MNRLSKCAALTVLTAGIASAEPEDITIGDLALTHPICFHVQAIAVTGWTRLVRESPKSEYWNRLIGGTDMLWAMHHYCWALIHLRRADAAGVSSTDKRYLREVAISDFWYVVRVALRLSQPNSFLMLPEIYYRIAEVNVLLGNTAPAIFAFEQARNIKPDYWPAYLGHARMLQKVGLRKEALRMLENGLQVIPDEPNLSAAFKELGGNPALVRPRVRPVQPTAAAAPAPASAPQ